MKKFNLKKPLSLYEDFAASDVSNPNQSVSPAGKTKTASITVDKVVATPTETPEVSATITSGDKVRAEIVQDVDAILTNLEALSKSITESINLEFDEFIKALTEGTLNEAEDGFMAKIMKSIASAKSYSTVMGTYPGMKKSLLKAKLTKTKKLAEIALKADEMQAKAMDKLSAKSKEAIAAADGIAAKQKLRAKRDQLEAKSKAQGAQELKTATASLTKKLDNVIRDINAKIAEVEKENPIESEDLKLRWAEQKLSIDDQHELDYIEKNGAIEIEYADGGDASEESKKKIEERMAKQTKKQNQENAEAKAAISDDLNSFKNKEAKEKEGDADDVKEAKAKIREFIDAHSTYLAKLKGTDFDTLNKEKPTDEEKAQIKTIKADILESQKKYNALKNGLSATTFATAEGTDKEKGAETLKAIQDATKTQLKDYKSQMDKASVDAMTDDDEEKKTAKTSQQLADDFIADNEGFKVISAEDKTVMVKVKNEESGEEEDKPKYGDFKEFKGKKEDDSDDETIIVAKEINYADMQSANTGGGKALNEGLHPKLKKAMKAVNKGETVYGENVRFPGRFKIIEMGELFATVDYEDGTEPMEMASMNIRIDSLQFESVEIEEAKEELPKKIKLYEGMSVADKFKALM